MSGIECFLIAPGDHARVWLRRYPNRELVENECPLPDGHGYHNAMVPLADAPSRINEDSIFDVDAPEVADDDPRWPTTCGCGYVFTENDHRQVHTETVWVAGDGREMILRDAPAGAMFDAIWMRGYGSVNGNGPAWTCVLPGGSTDGRSRVWHMGFEATNCTRKGEDHDCWCVHGEAPVLTVDKQPEPGRSTCQAGAGSIATQDWHGFLRDGFLVVA